MSSARLSRIHGPASCAALLLALLLAVGCDSIGSEEPEPEPLAVCEDSTAGGYPCQNVDLLAHLSVSELGGEHMENGQRARLNDIWGWTDPQTDKRYAIVGRSDGTAFVDVSEPTAPVYLGRLPSRGTPGAIQRDVKVYENHAFIVAEVTGHGMQVFDLTTLRNAGDGPQTFSETAHYDGFGRAHNLVLGGAGTARAYAVGLSGQQDVPSGSACGAGYHGVDLADPAQPQFAGCFNASLGGYVASGYTHDAQCVTYDGPDTEHEGKEICIGADETGLSVSDLTDLQNPVELAARTYPDAGYTHQGWFSEDQRYFFLNDELDELQGKTEKTRTQVWDLSDLDDPQLAEEYFGPSSSTDHNLYVRAGRLYEANYRSGLRVLDASNPLNLEEEAFFDTVPQSDSQGFAGAWSSYPFFEDGPVLVSSIGEGLFVLDVR